jgi:O-antigen/teichoic acid export membrane protein
MSKSYAVKAITLLWLGSLMGAGFAFLSQVILARQFGPAGLGVFAAALATVTLLTPLAGFGVAQFWLKVFGAEGWGAIRWLNASFKFVVISSVVAYVLLIAWAFFSPGGEESRYVLLVLSFYILGQVSVELVSAKLQLEEKYIILSLWQLFPHFLRLVFIVLFAYILTESIRVITVAYIYAAVAIAFIVAGWYALKNMKTGQFSLKNHKRTDSVYKNNSKKNLVVTDVIAQSWPFGLAGIFQLIYFQGGVIFVKYLASEEAAGLYSVAFSVMAAVYLLPGVVYQKFLLPKLHRWANHDRARFYQVYRQGNVVMLVIGITAMIGLWIVSRWAIPMLFGTAYDGSIVLLNIMAISTPIMFVAFNSGATLVTQDHMKKKIQFMAVVAVLNFLLNMLLIPIYGAIGAAVASVVSNSVLLTCYYYASKRIVFYDDVV